MRKLGCLISLALIGAAAPATAFAGGVFFGFGGGAGDVSFDDDTFAANRVVSDDSLVGEWLIGYRFDSKLVVEGGGTLGMSLDTLLLSDYFVLDDTRVMVGYAFQPGERFSIVPKLGVSFWHLDTEDAPPSDSISTQPTPTRTTTSEIRPARASASNSSSDQPAALVAQLTQPVAPLA
jgi:hypothetical protein